MVIIGLGNPGVEYADTRHNAGFRVADAVASALGMRLAKAWWRPYVVGSRARGGGCDWVVKPLTYMNRSGGAVRHVLRRSGGRPEDLLVVYDNVDLPPGSCRLKLRGATGGGHHGIESIVHALGTGDFMRLSVGIGRPPDGSDLAAYVLSAPQGGEAGALEQGIERAVRACLDLLDGDPKRIMNELNKRSDGPGGGRAQARDAGPSR